MMADLSVTNNKLYLRSINIINTITKCGKEAAGMQVIILIIVERHLLTAIYGSVPDGYQSMPIGQHVLAATGKRKVM